MGRSRFRITNPKYPHYITCTFVEWFPLFSKQSIATICLNSLNYLHENEKLSIYGWVFMENHAHFILRSPDISHAIWQFKSFTGRSIIDTLKQDNQRRILTDLHEAKLPGKHSQTYQVWKEGSHPFMIYSRKMMNQKLEYIHNNPVKRGYVDKGEEWRYSSKRCYLGKDGLLPVCTEW